MPRPEHFQPTVEDWPAVRAAWLDWAQGNRPDIANLPQLSAVLNVPYGTLTKKTGRWKREEAAKLAIQKEALDKQVHAMKPAREQAKAKPARSREPEPIGKGQRRPLNASSPPALGLVFTDQYRQARDLGKEALTEAMQGLIDEARNGTGASRITAIKELLDRSGLGKDTEKKDEATPYELLDSHVLKAMLIELLGELPGFLGLLKGQGPQDRGPTLEHTPPPSMDSAPTTISPLPSGSQNSRESQLVAEVEPGVSAVMVLSPQVESEMPAGPRVVLQ